ncbi:MAG: gamma-glutamyl-gamma-aminobutyrate hydrolase family protein [Bryobacteraceae bacterium]|nr:gamma-glutamyl-gamma-aminobutyrate hydrolase family protein [Bryobacteraceae bacterium]
MSKRVAFTFGRQDQHWTLKVAPYLEALHLAGLEPVLCLPGSRITLDRFAGLVLGGGTDLCPSRYGQSPEPETEAPDVARDTLEWDLLGQATQLGLPHLAICRGCQLLNVFHGGTLTQHIGDHHRQRGIADAHPVTVDAASALGRIVGVGAFAVNSRHHQAVSTVAPSLAVTASAGDGTVEGLEVPGHPFAVAVQWHPEDRVRTHPPDRRLFSAFARACV